MRSPESEPVVKVAALFVDWRAQPLTKMQKALNSGLEDEEARDENAPSIYSSKNRRIWSPATVAGPSHGIV